MLRLQSQTRTDWVHQALENLDDILIDHAHCEKKAASSALNFIFRYPEHLHFMQPLSELAREELRHFEQVLQVLEERKVVFGRQKPSRYAGKLVTEVRRDEPERMMDMMICASLIEARSCERMKILSEGLHDIDPKLARFYRGLLACEARHHQIYLDLLSSLYPRVDIQQRFDELAAHEAKVLETPGEDPRFHS